MKISEVIKEKVSESDLITERFVLLPALPPHLFTYSANLIGEVLERSVTVLAFNSVQHFKSYLQFSSAHNEQSIDLSAQILLHKGGLFDLDLLIDIGYTRVDRVWEHKEFSLHGDVLIIWQEGHSNPVRISLFNNVVEQIEVVDSITRRSISLRNTLRILPVQDRVADQHIEDLAYTTASAQSEEDIEIDGGYSEDYINQKWDSNGENLPSKPTHFLIGNEGAENSLECKFIYIKSLSFVEAETLGFPFIDLGFRTIPLPVIDGRRSTSLLNIIKKYISDKFTPIYLDSTTDRYNSMDPDIRKELTYRSVGDSDFALSKGFISTYTKEIFFTGYEIYGELNLADEELTGVRSRHAISQKKEVLLKQEFFKKIEPGDYVVHEDHGVGEYIGIVEKMGKEYLEVAYAAKDRLFIPFIQASKITKYIGGNNPTLTTLSGGMWRRIRKAADESATLLAKELLQLYAMRKITRENITYKNKINVEDVHKFVSTFKYIDTEDQMVATEQIIEDLSSEIPMDRLIVGDVGFGKTEIAFRAAYAVAKSGGQVAFLAPTTILVQQHLSLIKKRFEGSGLKIDALSRLNNSKERNNILNRLKERKIDILVGTHALLSSEVHFPNLALIVIDEEQKFGVAQKEKLKSQRVDTHVLSLTATPIPRTLSMSLSGLKDVSIIATPPPGRLPIINKFMIFDWDKVEEGLKFELDRGGQAYFLHNRVRNILFYKNKIQNMFKDKVVEVAHGQMDPHELALIMEALAEGEIDILVSTSIIENGIDLPNVNTLIVNDSNSFGLSQLYQIRGRVGRSDKQAYAYFLYKSLQGKAGERLDALSDSNSVGSGFMLANRDLEIRGAGNLLGKEQSGSINSVGYGMYMELLEQKIEEIKSGT